MSKYTASRTDRPAARKRGHSIDSLGRENVKPGGQLQRVAENGAIKGRRAKDVGAAPTEGDSSAAGGSLVQQAIRAVANYMRDQRLRPGDTLPGEKYFADELGVSRAVMREAFGALGALQIINIARGRKPKVSAVDGSLFATSIVHGFNTSQISIMDVWEVRKTVEIRATELAASARTDLELHEIQNIVDAIVLNMDDVDKVSRYNAEFHHAIARASRNVLLAQILASFSPITRIATREAWRNCTTKALRQAQVKRHKVIVRAIERRDPDAAADAMRQLFDDAIRENWSRLAAHRFSFDPFFDTGQLPIL
jgi:GntR family transcriptional regulator, transcriptional repressor for pyruvate dehydrogenase complex